MKPELRVDRSGFLGPIVPQSNLVAARFGGAGAAQTHAYRIHVYRATVLYCATLRALHRELVSDRHRRVEGVSDPKIGEAKPAANQIVEDTAPSVAALPAHRLDRCTF